MKRRRRQTADLVIAELAHQLARVGFVKGAIEGRAAQRGVESGEEGETDSGEPAVNAPR